MLAVAAVAAAFGVGTVSRKRGGSAAGHASAGGGGQRPPVGTVSGDGGDCSGRGKRHHPMNFADWRGSYQGSRHRSHCSP